MTSIEWLDEQLQDTMHIQYGYSDGVRKIVIPIDEYMKLKQIAKIKEKEQILDAHIEGQRVFDNYKHTQWTTDQAEYYYNETFKSE